jgi:DNA-binding beta-propeller fold protein YncE
LHYPEPVEVKETRPDGPQAKEPKYSKVIAWKLGETGTATDTFDLTDKGKPFMQKGEAEVVSTLAGVHEVFELENLNFDLKDHPLYKGGEEQESSKEAPVERATGLGTADGLALDLVNQKAYVTDRYGGKLYKVDLASRNTDWVLDKLGQVNDVALDLPGNKAYVTDYSGKRLFTVNLSDRSTSPVTGAEGMYAYGVALDLPGNKAYVTDVENGKLIEFDLNSESAQKQRTWDVPRAAGVALNGGKAYIGQYDRGGLYEVDLKADGGTPQAVATNLGTSVRVALDGAVNAYVSDSGGKLHEVVVADGEAKGRRRVVADGIGTVCGVGLDRDNGLIYVSNREGKLLRISGVLPDASAKS